MEGLIFGILRYSFGKEVISYNLIEQSDLVNKLNSFTFEP